MSKDEYIQNCTIAIAGAACSRNGSVSVGDMYEAVRVSEALADMLYNDECVAQEPVTVSESERDCIASAIEYCNGNKSKAAQMIGVSIRTIYRKAKQYGL